MWNFAFVHLWRLNICSQIYKGNQVAAGDEEREEQAGAIFEDTNSESVRDGRLLEEIGTHKSYNYDLTKCRVTLMLDGHVDPEALDSAMNVDDINEPAELALR